jgi:raffinose/stachyose/melibiose transport system permease protein
MATVHRPGLFVYYRWLVLLLVAGLCLVPLWATIIGGFKSSGELRTNALGLPRVWLLDNYVSIVAGIRFWQMLGNSAIIAGFTVFLTLFVRSMAAYVLAHLRFAGVRWLGNYLALGLTFPFCNGCSTSIHPRA